jgi:glucose-6-phosphate 1-dehydrogenase
MSETANVCDIVIFGGHGDLALRKLIPALYHLCSDGYLAAPSRIIATSREEMSREEHVALVREKLQLFLKSGCFIEEKWEAFERKLEVVTLDLGKQESYEALAEMLGAFPERERVNYLSTAPTFFGPICKALGHWGLITPQSRVVLEKPIGRDLASSQAINDEVSRYFEEQAIFRIDHYLGKDTVQNIIAMRFSNMLFMPLWNAQDIDHIQITAAESVGLEGRHSYYEDYGAFRDMIQNHLMQLLCLVAMEPPCSLDADSIRDEKVKVLRSLRPFTPDDVREKTVRGRYKAGVIDAQKVPGYLEEGVSPDSNTETFAAVRVDVDNWRWKGVPFYLRTGKRMSKRYTEIVVQFKEVPYQIFANEGRCISPNRLVIMLQPEESIKLKIMTKIPGLSEQMHLREVALDLNIPENAPRTPEAYERLLLDVIRNNATLFMRRDEVEAAWKWADPILKEWEAGAVPLKSYAAGSDGPSSAIALIERDGRSWYEEL